MSRSPARSNPIPSAIRNRARKKSNVFVTLLYGPYQTVSGLDDPSRIRRDMSGKEGEGYSTLARSEPERPVQFIVQSWSQTQKGPSLVGGA